MTFKPSGPLLWRLALVYVELWPEAFQGSTPKGITVECRPRELTLPCHILVFVADVSNRG